ncbi:kinase-like domain-containing protein [Mycena polygramma]|nr:kinase-like domain-containing protein [Mycena polygramma]
MRRGWYKAGTRSPSTAYVRCPPIFHFSFEFSLVNSLSSVSLCSLPSFFLTTTTMDDDVAIQELQATQEDEVEAGSTQPLSQEDDDFEQQLWGYLNPCLSQRIQRVNLFRSAQEYTLGRNNENMVIFPGFKISNYHAVLTWNGLDNAGAVIQIADTSSNGTYINGEKIGKGQQRLLKDGNEIAFGSPHKSLEEGGIYDYRFIFRDLVSGVVKRALYNSYDISTELGKGSFATVYKALHRRSGEWVAVKVIHETKRHTPTNTASDIARNNQSREITIMEDLHHPSICQLREVFWNANGSIDLVLELVEGGDLLDFILTNGGLSEAMSKHITFQLCQALAYIHQKGITHRDLKPENVLLTKDNPPIVKVADFGLAKVVSSITMLRTMCGTPSYLAPEVVTQQNSSGYDSLVDSWSVGVIEFSMLTNTTPFIESSVADLRARIASRNIDWSQLEQLSLTEEAIDFIRLLLEFSPRERMTMADALQHPWLINYIFAYPDIAYPDIIGVPSFTSTHALARANTNGEDVSMRTADGLSFTEAEAVSQGFEHLQLNGSSNGALLTPTNANGTAEMAPPPLDTNGNNQEAGGEGRQTPPSNTPPGLTLHKKGGLQRRSEVIAHAAETGRALVEPSWEMVSFMNSQGQPQEEQEGELTESQKREEEELYGAAASTTNGNPPTQQTSASASGSGSGSSGSGKGPNKRVHSELTPLPEEMEQDGVDGEGKSRGSSPLSSVEDSPRAAPAKKKGRSAGADDTATPGKTQPPTRGKRGGKAAPASTRKVRPRVDSTSAEGEEGSAKTPVATRRSTRAKSGSGRR